MSCEADCEVRLISHFYFFHSSKVLEDNNTFWQIQSISSSNPRKSPIIMQESWKFFVGTYNAKRKKVTQKTKKRKRLHQTIAQQTIQTTLQSPIVTLANAILEIYHHSCLQILGIEPAWKLPTFFEVNE